MPYAHCQNCKNHVEPSVPEKCPRCGASNPLSLPECAETGCDECLDALKEMLEAKTTLYGAQEFDR